MEAVYSSQTRPDALSRETKTLPAGTASHPVSLPRETTALISSQKTSQWARLFSCWFSKKPQSLSERRTIQYYGSLT